MPKATKGALLQCDPPQMAMILKIDGETSSADHKFVIERIDDRTCLVKIEKVDELKARVKALMDAAMGANDEEEIDQDSDLD